MTYTFMLDTNIVSDVIKHPLGRAGGRVVALPEGAACMSIVTAAELRFGARRVGSDRIWQKISDFAEFVPVLAFGHPAEMAYADIRSQLEARGQPIGAHDTLIAAHAIALDLTLVTANIREFSRVPGLRVENWLD